MIDYLIEASICIAAFYACYWFNLSRLKLLNLNRGYLLITLLLSLTIPLLDISLYQTEVSITPEIPDYVSITPVITSTQPVSGQRINPLLIVYFLGAGAAGISFILRLLRVFRLIWKSPRQKTGALWQVSVPHHQSVSSFFHYVFLPGNIENEKQTRVIMKHEQKHAQDWHSLDLIFLEVVAVLLWFNPIVYVYRRAIKLQHEYIADEAVSGTYGKAAYADLLVRYSLQKTGFELTHSFSEHPIEKRLKMIENTKATKMKKLRSVLIPLPLVAILFITIGCAQKAPVTITSAEKGATSQDEVSNELLERIQKGYAETVLSSSIRGIVQANFDGSGLGQVNITAYPSGNSVKTDKAGLYQLDTPHTDTLVVYSKTGYDRQNIPRKNFSVLNVMLDKSSD